MCGRYVLVSPPGDLADHFGARAAPGLSDSYRPSYNVAPTMPALAVAMREGQRVLDCYRWGLIPRWATRPSVGSRLFNARAETVATSPAFKESFQHRRVVVLADGFYEWRYRTGRRPQPFFFQRADGHPLAFAGLGDAWHDPADVDRDSRQRTCSIITTVGDDDMAEIHHRMPLILEPDLLDLWLDPATRAPAEMLGLPARRGTLVHHEVGPRVGDPRHDGPQLIAPLGDTGRPDDAEPEALRLF